MGDDVKKILVDEMKEIMQSLMKKVADDCAKRIIEKLFCQVCKVPLLTETWNVILNDDDISGQSLCSHCTYWFARETRNANGYNTSLMNDRLSLDEVVSLGEVTEMVKVKPFIVHEYNRDDLRMMMFGDKEGLRKG